ncbi:MAG: hypothetical protein IJW08_01235 [Lentisphaeria bacterium]|nr:hypothetical protein [Lentisphaeria bacterium]
MPASGFVSLRRDKAAQNSTLPHAASTDANKPFAFCRNPNLLHISNKSGLYQIKKYSAFLERERGARGERENFFSREKKFSRFPRIISPISGTNLFKKSSLQGGLS